MVLLLLLLLLRREEVIMSIKPIEVLEPEGLDEALEEEQFFEEEKEEKMRDCVLCGRPTMWGCYCERKLG